MPCLWPLICFSLFDFHLQEAAEKWITGLITHAKLNAKIDSKSGTVVMGVQSQGIHEQLVDKAKQLSVRTFMLANTVVGSGKA